MFKSIDLGMLVLRLAFGGIMLIGHGWPKLMSFFAEGPIQFADPFGLGPTITLILTVFAEVLCAFFVLIGFNTRISALVMAFTMFVATFIIHSKDTFFSTPVFGHADYAMLMTPFQEFAFIYGCGFLALALAGGGRFSLDQIMTKRV